MELLVAQYQYMQTQLKCVCTNKREIVTNNNAKSFWLHLALYIKSCNSLKDVGENMTVSIIVDESSTLCQGKRDSTLNIL